MSSVRVKDHLLEKDNSRRCFISTDSSGLARAKEAKARILREQKNNYELTKRVDELTKLVNSLLNKSENTQC
jgi:hypothetical protein